MDIWNEFLSKKNFAMAYQRIKTSPRDEFKMFYKGDFQAFEFHFDDNIEQLIQDIQEGIYKPKNPCIYYIPKSNHLARPITLLNLIDYIVYQAIANIISDIYYPYLCKYFNNDVFGNCYNSTTDESAIFFMRRWSMQWNKYNQTIKKYYQDGYEYCAKFDIATFYEAIDHSILKTLLSEKVDDERFVGLFVDCLRKWTYNDTSTFKYEKDSGIPQGPVSSRFFAELYLSKIDEAMRRKNTIVYLRYADDIRILSKKEINCRKMLVYLDLLVRDLGLHTQASKVSVVHIDNIHVFIKESMLDFSKITNEYKRNGKSLGKGNQRKLKKKFLDCFKGDGINKTIIKYALFKLNKDDEIRRCILDNFNQFDLFLEGMIYYFNTHYPADREFHEKMLSCLRNDDMIYQYDKSIIFNCYENLTYDGELYTCFKNIPDRYWILKYRFDRWLEKNEQYELLAADSDNYYINRDNSEVIFNRKNNHMAKINFLEEMISSADPMISLSGCVLWSKKINDKIATVTNNNFSKKFVDGSSRDFFSYLMEKEYGLEVPEILLSLCRENDKRYLKIKEVLQFFYSTKGIDAVRSLQNLDSFHNLLLDVIIEDWQGESKQYKVEIDQIGTKNLLVKDVLEEIHDMRNKRTEAHPQIAKTHEITKRIGVKEYAACLEKWNLEEVYRLIFAYYV